MIHALRDNRAPASSGIVGSVGIRRMPVLCLLLSRRNPLIHVCKFDSLLLPIFLGKGVQTFLAFLIPQFAPVRKPSVGKRATRA